jgi:hypothetical protein
VLNTRPTSLPNMAIVNDNVIIPILNIVWTRVDIAHFGHVS